MFGPYHTIYPPSGWRANPVAKHHGPSGRTYAEYLKTPQSPLRLVCHETTPGTLRIVYLAVDDHQAYNDFIGQLPKAESYRPVHNYDEDPAVCPSRINTSPKN